MAIEPVYNRFATRSESQALRAGKLVPCFHVLPPPPFGPAINPQSLADPDALQTLRDQLVLRSRLILDAVHQALLILTLPYQTLPRMVPSFLLLAYQSLLVLLTRLGSLSTEARKESCPYRTVPILSQLEERRRAGHASRPGHLRNSPSHALKPAAGDVRTRFQRSRELLLGHVRGAGCECYCSIFIWGVPLGSARMTGVQVPRLWGPSTLRMSARCPCSRLALEMLRYKAIDY
ncbi:hypothetical protein DOTSEDRAFT_34615 [Dothistroma septosporum NZE10]|uniref:Uncharacterized protein n=1 Tax=Dothistroma septosporum (strain NZE10 / CBS 128990) TaxID=675120 RepID=N1PKT1_DOTSN|nr:hypothetical protein DOTSEDRAFT_34615 [Dothistroma septosporum NZE10]